MLCRNSRHAFSNAPVGEWRSSISKGLRAPFQDVLEDPLPGATWAVRDASAGDTAARASARASVGCTGRGVIIGLPRVDFISKIKAGYSAIGTTWKPQSGSSGGWLPPPTTQQGCYQGAYPPSTRQGAGVGGTAAPLRWHPCCYSYSCR